MTARAKERGPANRVSNRDNRCRSLRTARAAGVAVQHRGAVRTVGIAGRCAAPSSEGRFYSPAERWALAHGLLEHIENAMPHRGPNQRRVCARPHACRARRRFLGAAHQSKCPTAPEPRPSHPKAWRPSGNDVPTGSNLSRRRPLRCLRQSRSAARFRALACALVVWLCSTALSAAPSLLRESAPVAPPPAVSRARAVDDKWLELTLPSDPYNSAEVSNPRNYGLTSSDDPAFTLAQAPVAVNHRHWPEKAPYSSALDRRSGDIASIEVTWRIFLELPHPLALGKHYRLSVHAVFGRPREFLLSTDGGPSSFFEPNKSNPRQPGRLPA